MYATGATTAVATIKTKGNRTPPLASARAKGALMLGVAISLLHPEDAQEKACKDGLHP